MYCFSKSDTQCSHIIGPIFQPSAKLACILIMCSKRSLHYHSPYLNSQHFFLPLVHFKLKV